MIKIPHANQFTNFMFLEIVLIGESITLYHRMVTCAKSNDKPRRAVDFQPLNLHATGKVCHIQSAFH